jgi:hypothetical protein
MYLNKEVGKPMKKLDVMDCIHKDMYLFMLDKMKAPMYAPYVMKLIIGVEIDSPLVTNQLVMHNTARVQKKTITFSDDDEDGSLVARASSGEEDVVPHTLSGPSTAFDGST